MENHEHNLQQEIIDSLSRKYTELEKRQSKLETSNLEAMPNQIKELEKTIAEIKIMNTTEINDQLKQYGNQLYIYGQQLKSFPKEIPIRNKIEFDTKSRFVVRMILSLIGFAAMSIGVIVVLVVELSSRSDYKDKYKIVQGFYPSVADQVDSAFLVNKDTLLHQAEINIEHRKELINAELDAKDADVKSQMADEKLRKLRKLKLK